MGLFNFFTRKNTTSTPYSQEQIHSIAAANAKAKTGRSGQFRMANMLPTAAEVKEGKTINNIKGRKTNVYYKRYNEKKAELEKFNLELGKTLKNYGNESNVKSALQDVISELEKGISAASGGAHSGGADNVTISIPKAIAKLLVGILKVILFAVGLLFTIALVLAGANGNLGPTEAVGAFAAANLVTSTGTPNRKTPEERVPSWGGGRRRKTLRKRRE